MTGIQMLRRQVVLDLSVGMGMCIPCEEVAMHPKTGGSLWLGRAYRELC
jgi:hypothetical protein